MRTAKRIVRTLPSPSNPPIAKPTPPFVRHPGTVPRLDSARLQAFSIGACVGTGTHSTSLRKHSFSPPSVPVRIRRTTVTRTTSADIYPTGLLLLVAATRTRTQTRIQTRTAPRKIFDLLHSPRIPSILSNINYIPRRLIHSARPSLLPHSLSASSLTYLRSIPRSRFRSRSHFDSSHSELEAGSVLRFGITEMYQRRNHSTRTPQEKVEDDGQKGRTGHNHDNGHDNAHSQSPSILGHAHSHADGNGHSHSHSDAEQIVAVLSGEKRDRGSYITLVGLASNVVLTATKGLAGWYMHSASLLADAGHSLSDLLGDFVTLFCWSLSRKPPTRRYPYGFAKFETLGTTTISILLIGGALGIGVHSYNLLLSTLSQSVSSLPSGTVIHDVVQTVVQNAPPLSTPFDGHAHVHAVGGGGMTDVAARTDVLDVNAAWFAGMSVVVKEWLYWITKKVAEDEKSPVLYANALHHRSDAFSSMVALLAILGTWCFPGVPLDPIGGLLVSVIIVRQGFLLLKGALGDLTDAGVSRAKRETLKRTLIPLIKNPSSPSPLSSPESSRPPSPFSSPVTAQASLPKMDMDWGSEEILPHPILAIADLRARRAGSLLFVDLTAHVDKNMSVTQAAEVEKMVEKLMKEKVKEVKEVRVKFVPGD